MIKSGRYVAEQDGAVFDAYKITVDVKVSDKAVTLQLVENTGRYSTPQIDDMFAKSSKVRINLDGSRHALQIWSDSDFTLYPYRVGVPYYFQRCATEGRKEVVQNVKTYDTIAPIEKELIPVREIKELRAMTGLSQQKFGDALGIPLRTIQNWELGQRECPQYVADLLEYRITHDKKFKKSEKEIKK